MATQGKKDFYAVLGLSRGASDDDIRAAYRRLARQHHPDVSDAPESAERFAEISDAYAVLSDPEKRAAYDRFGHGATAGRHHHAGGSPFEGGPGGADFGDLFEQMFGGGSPFGGAGAGTGARPRPARGPDVHRNLTVSFLTAVRGGTEVLHVGAETGKSERIEVKIPAGIEDGAKLRMKGRGGSGEGGAGDLIVAVTVGAHPLFRRDGLDLLVDVPITIAEAALGATVTAPLLSGSVELKVPPGASSGQKLRVPGKGIIPPSGDPGNYYAVVQIVAPRELSDAGRRLVEQLAQELQNPRQSGPWAEIP